MTDPGACEFDAGEDIVCGFDRPGSGRGLTATGRLYGPVDAPPVIVLGGVSAGRVLLDDSRRKGWWPGIAGRGCVLDPALKRILSADYLGEEVAPFPTIADQADAVLALAEAAGFDRFAVIGASFGGAVALGIGARVPDRVTRLDILCAATSPGPMTSALRSIERDIVALAVGADDGRAGVALARRLAMTRYRTAEEFRERFTAGPGQVETTIASVNRYLEARGKAYAEQTSPERFLALSRSMDSADIEVEAITAPTRFLAFDSDQLVPKPEIESTALRIKKARLAIETTRFGHDGFLKEIDIVARFLGDRS